MRMFLLNRSLPKWIILVIDQIITSWSFGFAYFLIKQFEFSTILRGHFLIYISLYCVVSLITFYFMRLHTGLIRYSSTQDIYRIFSAVLICSLVYGAIVGFGVIPAFNIDSVNIYVVLFVNFFFSSSLLVILRLGAKEIFSFMKRSVSGQKETFLIYGSDSNAILLKHALEESGMGKFNVAGFIDDNASKVNKEIHQRKVYHIDEIEKVLDRIRVDKLVVMSEDLKAESRKKTIEKCVELGVKVLTVPPTSQWMSGHLQMNQMQDLKIEDLLQRQPIVIENSRISDDISGKRVLVTGGAGSIGAEIVRQVLNYSPEMVIICDQAETPLHDLQLDIEENYPEINLKICMADISNFNRMYNIFNDYTPHIVYHAAAYKHVPMIENNPSEAIMTNILGTKNLADLSMAFDVEKFVMVSTDKAVNPTNIMGASKRIAEIYTQSLNNIRKKGTDVIKSGHLPVTKFITTRFGNVLGSNGSVIPRFRSQIEKGGPVTVTHPDITRYFMTIPEAVQLVLEAGTMGNGGEIFIFDMGQPVRIVDLAKKMIKLAGMTPDVEMKIVYTGLRPGEKLYEELLNIDEKTIPTHHHKIKISKVRKYSYEKVVGDIAELLTLNKHSTDLEVVRKMKEIVPEFKSKNSKYEELDAVN